MASLGLSTVETKLVNQKVTSDYANAAVQSHQGDKAPEETKKEI